MLVRSDGLPRSKGIDPIEHTSSAPAARPTGDIDNVVRRNDLTIRFLLTVFRSVLGGPIPEQG